MPADFSPFSNYLEPLPALSTSTPMPPPETRATGEGDWLTAGLMSGVHGAISQGARALQAGAQLVGADETAQSLADIAESHHATERSYARPDLEEASWLNPAKIAYEIARMAPVTAGAIGAGSLAALAAPEVAAGGGAVALTSAARAATIAGRLRLGGAGLAMYPFAAGENVQRQISETGELTTPGKALLWGVPEAAAQAVVPGRVEKILGEGIKRGIIGGAIAQGAAGGATEWMTQKMGDPDRSFADRAAAIGSAALGGAALGGIMGGAFGGLRKLVGKPGQEVSNKNMEDATDQVLRLPLPRQDQAAARAAAAEAARAAAPSAPIAEGPPLHDMSPLDLWTRLSDIQQHLTANPEDQDALRAHELLGQEYQRRAAEAAGVEAPPAPPEIFGPKRITYQPGTPLEMPPPLQGIPSGELAGHIDTLQRNESRTPEETEVLRLFQEEQQRRAIDEASTKAHEPQPQKLLAPPARVELPPVEEIPPDKLWMWLSRAQEHLTLNPQDPTALRVSDLLRQEVLRRAEEARGEQPPAVAPGEPPVVGASAAPAVPPPVLNFTARLTESALKKGMEQVRAAPAEAQDAVKQQLLNTILARGDKPLTAGLRRWAKEFDLLTPDGKELRDEFIPEQPVEVPPGVEPEAPAVEPPAAAPVEPPAAEPYPEFPAFLDRTKNPAPFAAPATHVASEAPIETADQRLAAVNGIAAEIANLPDSPAKEQHVAEAETVMKLLPLAENNPGLVTPLNDRIKNLQDAVGAEAQPAADQVATPDLAPSPRAEATPAPMGDLDAKLTKAQRALNFLRKALGNRPDAFGMLDEHEQWLEDVRKGVGPEAMREALKFDPEADPEGDNLTNLPELKKPMRDWLNVFLNAQEQVRQELRAQSDSRARVIASRDGLPVTQLDADVTDLHQRGASLTDVASHIIEHTADPEEAAIVAKLQQALPKDVKTGFRDGVTDKEGEYFTKQKTSMLYNAANATATAIHEMAHAVYHRALEAGGTAAKAINGIYDQLKNTDNHVGITDAHEMLSEAAGNPTYRAFLKSQFVKGTSLWDRLVDVGRGMLGLDPRLYNAFDRLMSFGDDLLKEHQQLPNEWNGPNSYARNVDQGTKSTSATAEAALQAVNARLENASDPVQKFWKSLTNAYWLAQNKTYNALAQSIPKFVDTLMREDPRRIQMASGANVVDRLIGNLPPEGRAIYDRLTAASTLYGYHPDKTAADYIERFRDNPEEYEKFKEITGLYNQLKNIPGGQEAYKTSRAQNWNYWLMHTLHDLQEVERTAGVPVDDVFNKFGQADVHDMLTTQPQKANEWLRTELNNKLAVDKATRDNLATQKAEADAPIAKRQAEIAAAIKAKVPKDQLNALREQDKDLLAKLADQSADLDRNIKSLDTGMKDATKLRDRMEQEPYFHLGRQGDFFVTGKVVMTPGPIDPETGKPSTWVPHKEMLAKLADHLEQNGVNDVAIMQGGTNDTFYSKLETPAQQRELHRVLEDAQRKGLLSKDSPIKSGKILDDDVFNRVSSEGMRDIIALVAGDKPQIPAGATPDQIAELNKSHYDLVQNLRANLLNMTPETSMARILAQRKGVQGFAKDMRQNQAYAADLMSSNLARMTLKPELSEAQAGMQKELEAANANPDVGLNTKRGLANTINELMRQQQDRKLYVPKSPMDAIRNMTNVMALGSSPAYFLMNVGQTITTGIPELMKTHGYTAPWGAVTRAMPQAFNIVRAVFDGGKGLTAPITREGLEKYNLPKPVVDLVMGLVRRGSLQTYTGQVAERTKDVMRVPFMSYETRIPSTVLKAFNTLGLYSDLTPRLIMALAANDLYTAKPYSGMTKEQFVDKAITQSQGYYGTAGGARMISRGGPLGVYGQMIGQFMQFNLQMTNKIYREAADGVGGDKQTQAEARRWLAGHAAAVTMLSGTLGLPLVSVAASVYDNLANWVTNRDDHNLLRSYQTFLNTNLGKDFGEIVARGIPRAAGTDLTNWGEADIVPGSTMINTLLEKRKFDDMKSDWFKGMGGPALNQLFQLYDGMTDIMGGDYLKGMIKLSPGIVKDFEKTYQLTNQGFIDQHGQKLPIMSPNAWDYIQTALGMRPEKLVQYQERQRDFSGMRAMRQASSANISQHLRQAYMQGDRAALNTWMGEAYKWQVDHPGLMPPNVSFARSLQMHLQQLAQARGMGLPVGVRPQDIGARRMFGTVQ